MDDVKLSTLVADWIKSKGLPFYLKENPLDRAIQGIIPNPPVMTAKHQHIGYVSNRYNRVILYPGDETIFISAGDPDFFNRINIILVGFNYDTSA